MSVVVCGTTAEAIVLSGVVELVAVKVALIEIDMATMLESTGGSPSKDEWQVGVAVAVAISHAAAKQGHGGVKQRATIKVWRLS